MQSLGGMTNRVITYQYDGMQRLLSADYVENGTANRSYDYTYDLNGNRTSETVFDGLSTLQTVFAYNLANQMTSMQVGANPVRQFTYDGAGNLLEDGVNGYLYDAASRLTQFTDGRTRTTTSFAYNGLGDLVRQSTNGAATNYLLDMNSPLTQLLAEYAPAGETWYLPGMDIIGQQTNGAWGYFGYDGLGSVRAVFDLAGQYASLTSYAPYGAPFEQYASPSRLGFTGEQTVAGELNYLRARYYNPSIGTFLTRDPFSGTTNNAMSRNGYSYVHGNPANWTDPSGKFIGALGAVALIAAAIIFYAALTTAAPAIQNYLQNLRNTFESNSYNSGGGGTTYNGNSSSVNGGLNCAANLVGGVENALRIVRATFNVAGGATRDFPGLGVSGASGTNLLEMEQDDDDAVPYPLDFPQDRDDDETYYFRGTTLGYAGGDAARAAGVTPTSTQPGIATIFAINAQTVYGGQGVVYITSSSEMSDVSIGYSNLLYYEMEVVFNIQIADFSARSFYITVERSMEILQTLGLTLPNRIYDDEMSPLIRDTLHLTRSQISAYVAMARGIP
jgi:RHS repeat-associated protein